MREAQRKNDLCLQFFKSVSSPLKSYMNLHVAPVKFKYRPPDFENLPRTGSRLPPKFLYDSSRVTFSLPAAFSAAPVFSTSIISVFWKWVSVDLQDGPDQTYSANDALPCHLSNARQKSPIGLKTKKLWPKQLTLIFYENTIFCVRPSVLLSDKFTWASLRLNLA